MSIATQIQRLNTAKANIKNSVNIDFNKITNQTIDGYSALIDSTIEEYKNYIPQSTVSGVPVHIDDGVGALKPINLKIEGNTTQETTTGKNLFYIGDEQTKDGITVTKNADGSINIHGKNTLQNDSGVVYFADFNSAKFEENVNYILSANKPLPNGLKFRIDVYNDNTWIRQFFSTISNSIPTSTGVLNKSNGNRLRFAILGVNGVQIDIDNLIIQAEKGTTATSYEPYTGGIASPNPDYPQSIESVGELQNLIDYNLNVENYYYNSSGIKVIMEDSYMTYINQIYNNVISGTKYFFDFKNSFGGNAHLRLCEYDNNENFIKRTLLNTKNQVITLSDTTKKIILSIDKSYIQYFDTPILYEDGKKYAIPVTVASENLFDITKITENRYIDGYRGNEHGNIGTSSVTNLSDYMKVNSNKKYCFKYDYTTLQGTGNRGYIFYDKNKNVLNKEIETVYSPINKETYITSFENAEYIRIAYDKNCNNIEFFETETSYIYLNEPLRKIGDTMDYVDYKNKQVVRNIGEVVLNGSENWNNDTGTVGEYYRHNIELSRLSLTNVDNSSVKISNYFIYLRKNSGDWGNFYLSNAWLVFQDKNKVHTLDTFKSWLATNNVTVDYILATPKTETIELPEILLVDGANNISVETKIEPSNIKLNYYKDWRVA